MLMLPESEPKFKTLPPLPWPTILNEPIGTLFDITLKCQSKRKEDTNQTSDHVAEFPPKVRQKIRINRKIRIRRTRNSKKSKTSVK